MGYKTNLNEFKRIEVIQCLLLDHNEIKVEINNKEIIIRTQNTWWLNNILLNKKTGQEKNLIEILKIFWTKIKMPLIKVYSMCQSSPYREIYAIECI